jgi:hypothetical protein
MIHRIAMTSPRNAAVGRRRSRHPLVERLRSFSICELRRDKAFDVERPTALQWPGFEFPGLLSVITDRWGCTIAFNHRDRRIEQRIPICVVRRFGHVGELLFRCDCGRRAETLFDTGRGRYACKRCCGAHYACQAVSTNRRKIARAMKLRQRIGAQQVIGAHLQRPARMYRPTFERIRRMIMRIEAGIKIRRRLVRSNW